MDDTLQTAVRYPEDVKTKPIKRQSDLGSAEGYVNFVEVLSKDSDEN